MDALFLSLIPILRQTPPPNTVTLWTDLQGRLWCQPNSGVPTQINDGVATATSLPYAATVTPDSKVTQVANIGTLTGDISIANPLGAPFDGQTMRFRFAQDATGGWVIAWGSAFSFGTDVTAALIPSAASAKWEMVFEWNAADSKWRAVGIARGF